MRQFATNELCDHVQALAMLRVAAETVGVEGRLSTEMLADVVATVERARVFCTSIGFLDSSAKLGRSIASLNRESGMTVSAIGTELRNILEQIFMEAEKHRFVQVLQDRADFMGKDKPFGDKVGEAFPSTTRDLQEACNCLAVECNPAAVYHLMCAAEIGLRALARDRRIKFPRGPIELHQWGDILKELEKAVVTIQGWPRTLARESAHQFYNKSLSYCREFNGAYRRHIAHARDHYYDRHEALSVASHVRSFLETLAEKISEKKITPKVWRQASVRHL